MLFTIIEFLLLFTVTLCQEVDITKGPPALDKPWVPAWGWYGETQKEAWKQTHESLLKITKENATHINIIFLGDSITRRWSEDGKEIWASHYANRGAYNYGVGSDSTRQVLWRIQHGELDGLNPKVLVLLIGTNNLYDDFNGNATSDEIAKGIKAIVDLIRMKLPYTKIILLGILPRDHWYTDILQDVNYIIEGLHDQNYVYYLDMTLDFEETPGFIRSELFSDGLHLNKAGYEKWYTLMEPLLKHLLDPLTELDITHVPPTWDKPWVPTYGWWGATTAWKFIHENYVHQSFELKDKAKAIFVGDSITMNWGEDGKDVWNAHYANRDTYNYGMGADSTRQVLWRIEHGEFEGLKPKVLVLMIGTNNLYDDFNGNSTDEEIVRAIHLVIETFQMKFPGVKVLLLGILPRDEYFMTRIRNINGLISKFGDNKTIYYLDMSSHYLNAAKQMNPSLYLDDKVHLNKAGYQLWYETMETLFSTLLKA